MMQPRMPNPLAVRTQAAMREGAAAQQMDVQHPQVIGPEALDLMRLPPHLRGRGINLAETLQRSELVTPPPGRNYVSGSSQPRTSRTEDSVISDALDRTMTVMIDGSPTLGIPRMQPLNTSQSWNATQAAAVHNRTALQSPLRY